MRPVRAEAAFWSIFIATAIGFTAIVFFGRAGELVRPYLIANKEKVSFSSQIAAWILERMLDLIMVLVIFGFALAQISGSGITPGPRLALLIQAGGWIVGLTGALCLGLLIVFRYFSETMQRRLLDATSFLPEAYRQKIDAFLSAFLAGMQSTKRNTYVFQLIFYSVVEWLLIIACYVCLLRAFPATSGLTLTDVVIFMGFVSFGAAIQIPGVGGGLQVAAVFVLTEFFGLSLETATGLALVLWCSTFVVIVPFGVVLAFREGLQWRKLSHISEEVSE